MSVTKICELVADQLGASVRRSVLRPVVDQILREKADAAAAIESAAGDSDGGASDGGAPEEYALEEEESEEARNDEMDVDGSEAEAALRSRVLYFTDPPDWADIEQEARQIGCDDAWLQGLKQKYDQLHEALNQARFSTALPLPLRCHALSSRPHLTLTALPQVEAADTHAAVLGVATDATDAERNRAFRRLALLLHPDKHPLAPDAFLGRIDLAFKKLNNAKDAPDLSRSAGSGDSSGSGSPQPPRQQTDRQRQAEEQRRAAEQKRQEKQARDRAAAEAASARASAFQQAGVARIQAPLRASEGVRPAGMNVDLAKVYDSKVPTFGSMLKTEAGKDVALLPTVENTLLIEAGCAAEKTRQLVAWLIYVLENFPDMPVLFVTCRKTHADDLWATLREVGGFKNYLDAKASGVSKKKYLKDATRLIVSLQSLDRVNLELYKGGIFIADEIRSAFSIPGGETLPQPGVASGALAVLCSNARYRVAMDADVSADGAVEAGLRLIAPRFDVLQVQLQQATLKRVMSLSFTEPKGSPGRAIFMSRLKLWLLRVRWVSERWVSKQMAKKHAASIVLWLLKQQWGREDAANGAPSDNVKSNRERQQRCLRKQARAKDILRAWAIMRQLRMLESEWGAEDEANGEPSTEVQSERESLRLRLMQRGKTAYFDRQRVLVCCATPSEARNVARMCDTLGVTYHYYSGSTSDKDKREHFKNTTTHWFDAAVVISTTTMTVAVNVRIHFSVAFLWCRRAEQAGRLRELFQALVRVGRDEDDPLEDIRIYTLMPGEPPDFSKFNLVSQEERYQRTLRGLKGQSATVGECEEAARKVYERVSGGSCGSTPSLDEPMLELFAWNRLEGSDNCGDMALVKLVELCKLPTRAWPIELTPELTEAEQTESEALGKEPAPLLPDEAEDRAVGKMSMAGKFGWLLGDLRKRAEAAAREQAANATIEINNDEMEQMIEKCMQQLKANFFAEQEGLRSSQTARPEKDARDIAKEKIFDVIEPLGDLPGDLDPKDFGELAVDDTMGKLQRRAAASTMPLEEQQKVYERLRHDGRTAHPMVVIPWHTQTRLLQQLADALGLPIDRLLTPTSFTSEDDWVQVGGVHRGALSTPRLHPPLPLSLSCLSWVSPLFP